MIDGLKRHIDNTRGVHAFIGDKILIYMNEGDPVEGYITDFDIPRPGYPSVTIDCKIHIYLNNIEDFEVM